MSDQKKEKYHRKKRKKQNGVYKPGDSQECWWQIVDSVGANHAFD